MIDELDLKILKTLLTHNVHGLEFAYNLNASLFSPETKSFAKIVLDYIKSFKSVPTRRTLLDRHNGNVVRTNEINQIWDRIDSFEYDTNEYTYDLEKLKKRFQAITVNTLKDQLAKEQDIDPEATLKNVLLTVQQTNVIKAGRAYTQKIVGDYLEEFSDRYEGRKENPENKPSVQTGFSLIDYVTGGLVPTDLFIAGGESGAGKALDINTLIPTPNGWSKMGDLKPGDIVFGDDGKPCNVVAISGIMYNHECYEVGFSDGAKITADAGHLWETFTNSERKALLKRTDEYRAKRRASRPRRGTGVYPWLVLRNQQHPTASLPPPIPKARTTKEIYESIMTVGKRAAKNHSVRTAKPLELPDIDLPIDPYLLGVWLGDGTASSGSVTNADIEIIHAFGIAGYKVKKWAAKYAWGIAEFKSQLRAIGLINNKHIPLIYLRASFEQRLALIQGLMDTDGHAVLKTGGCEFDNTSIPIIKGMLELLRSIGVRAKYNTGIAKLNGRVIGPKYRILFWTEFPVFRLLRKLNRQKKLKLRLADRRFITYVKKVRSVPVQCIQVDSKSNCYLCGEEMIPTHNSFWLNNMAINMWLQTNTINTHPDNFAKGHNILYFSLEMPYEDCFIRFMSRLANVPQRELYSSTLTDEQSQRVARAHEFIKQYQKAGYYFGIVDIPRNATIEELELRYNDALLTYRPDIVVVDYLGLMHIHGFAGEADWLKQGAISASLHEFSRAYDIIMLTAAQLTDIKRGSTSDKSEETKRVGMHRMGRSSMIMHNVTLGVQIETRPSEMGYPDLRYHIIKNRRGPLGQGNLIKNFAHASLIDVPYVDAASGPADVDYEGLIKSIRDSHENTE